MRGPASTCRRRWLPSDVSSVQYARRSRSDGQRADRQAGTVQEQEQPGMERARGGGAARRPLGKTVTLPARQAAAEREGRADAARGVVALDEHRADLPRGTAQIGHDARSARLMKAVPSARPRARECRVARVVRDEDAGGVWDHAAYADIEPQPVPGAAAQRRRTSSRRLRGAREPRAGRYDHSVAAAVVASAANRLGRRALAARRRGRPHVPLTPPRFLTHPLPTTYTPTHPSTLTYTPHPSYLLLKSYLTSHFISHLYPKHSTYNPSIIPPILIFPNSIH
jgi:hypothetical protein